MGQDFTDPGGQITLLPVEMPFVARKMVTVACDGGRLPSDGGVPLFARSRAPGALRTVSQSRHAQPISEADVQPAGKSA